MHMLFPSEKCNNVKQLFQEGHTDDQRNSSTMRKLMYMIKTLSPKVSLYIIVTLRTESGVKLLYLALYLSDLSL